LSTLKLQHLLSAFFVMAVLSVTLLSGPCAASLVCSNTITLENDGMNWDSEECITGGEAIFFRELIDRETGNKDSFVNAWEIRNMELELRDEMEKSIEKKPDVKLNGSSEAVKVRDVEFWLSDEALGTTSKITPITNTAKVTYSFEEVDKEKGEEGENETEPSTGIGNETGTETSTETSIWFLGTPDSEVTIFLPPGYDASRTEGLEDKSEDFEESRKVLKGSFDPEGEMTLWLLENKSYETAALMEDLSGSDVMENGTLPAEDPEPEETQASVGFFENFLGRLYLGPKA
jgi:hypothetical protein